MDRAPKRLLIFLIFLSIIWAAGIYFSPPTFERDSLYIQSGTRLWPIEVEIAKSEKQKKKGLMNRRHLKESNGMLFVWREPQVMHMWMKDTRIPLDMLFIDAQGIIVHIAPNRRPQSTESTTYEKPVLAVLELPGGTTKKLMIKLGDLVMHPIFEPGK